MIKGRTPTTGEPEVTMTMVWCQWYERVSQLVTGLRSSMITIIMHHRLVDDPSNTVYHHDNDV